MTHEVPLLYSAHLTKDLAQAQGGHCWHSPAKSWVSWQPVIVGRSDLCNMICGYSLGQGLVAKGAGAPDDVCFRSHGLTGKLVPRRMQRQGGCVTSALGTTLLLFGSRGHSCFRCACAPIHTIHAEQAHSAQRHSQRTTRKELSSATEIDTGRGS